MRTGMYALPVQSPGINVPVTKQQLEELIKGFLFNPAPNRAQRRSMERIGGSRLNNRKLTLGTARYRNENFGRLLNTDGRK